MTGIGFASVYIARQAVVSWGSLFYAGLFIALYLVAHAVARVTVPNADPYLLPIAGLLTAIGLTEIYRLGPTEAFKQGLWIVIGVVVAATHHFFDHVSTIGAILSAIIAVILWPLILLGVKIAIII